MGSTATGGRSAAVASAPLATSTGLALSATRVPFGHEQAERLTVTVTGPVGDTPTGQVTITAGAAIIAVVTLAGGSGTVMLSAGQLSPGIYQLTASYGGDLANSPSASGAQALTVLPLPMPR
jgi:hypothetical protein